MLEKIRARGDLLRGKCDANGVVTALVHLQRNPPLYGLPAHHDVIQVQEVPLMTHFEVIVPPNNRLMQNGGTEEKHFQKGGRR